MRSPQQAENVGNQKKLMRVFGIVLVLVGTIVFKTQWESSPTKIQTVEKLSISTPTSEKEFENSKIASDWDLVSCVMNLASKVRAGQEKTNDEKIMSARVHGANGEEIGDEWKKETDMEETFVNQDHKVLRVSADENQVAVVYADNMVVMVDGSQCRVTDIFHSGRDGSMNPRVVSNTQSMAVRPLNTPKPTVAPTNACRPNHTKRIRVVYMNRGGYDVTKVRFSIYNLAGQQLIPGGSVVKTSNLRKDGTHHIAKTVMWCWQYRVRIRIWIALGDAKQENWWVSYRVWRDPDEATDPGEGGDSFCAYSQGTTLNGNDVKREKSGWMPTSLLGATYDCSSYDHLP